MVTVWPAHAHRHKLKARNARFFFDGRASEAFFKDGDLVLNLSEAAHEILVVAAVMNFVI